MLKDSLREMQCVIGGINKQDGTGLFFVKTIFKLPPTVDYLTFDEFPAHTFARRGVLDKGGYKPIVLPRTAQTIKLPRSGVGVALEFPTFMVTENSDVFVREARNGDFTDTINSYHGLDIFLGDYGSQFVKENPLANRAWKFRDEVPIMAAR